MATPERTDPDILPAHQRREQIVRDLDDRLTTVLDGIEQAAAVAWVDACDAGQAVSVMAS